MCRAEPFRGGGQLLNEHICKDSFDSVKIVGEKNGFERPNRRNFVWVIKISFILNKSEKTPRKFLPPSLRLPAGLYPLSARREALGVGIEAEGYAVDSAGRRLHVEDREFDPLRLERSLWSDDGADI